MSDSEYLRERAKAAEVAGNKEMADALNAEANDLESASPTGDTAPQ